MRATNRKSLTGSIVNAELGAGVEAEIELGQIPLQVLTIHVLIGADQAPFEYAEKAFESVGVHVAARPFELGVIDAFVRCMASELVVLGLVGDDPRSLVNVLADHRADHAVIEERTVDVHVLRLRKALKGADGLIRTVRSVGYMLSEK